MISKAPKRPKGGKRSPFYWWRRFRSHKPLPYRSGLIDKIRNGDFEYPALFEQANWELQWMQQDLDAFISEYTGNQNPKTDSLYIDIEKKYRKRYNLLREDGDNIERVRLTKLVESLSKKFFIHIDTIIKWMETFDNTTEELYNFCAKHKNMNANTVKFLDKQLQI
jgi:hypothetical protein